MKYNICLTIFLQQGISEPVFYGNLVYKCSGIIEIPNFSDQFKRLLYVIKEWDTAGINILLTVPRRCFMCGSFILFLSSICYAFMASVY